MKLVPQIVKCYRTLHIDRYTKANHILRHLYWIFCWANPFPLAETVWPYGRWSSERAQTLSKKRMNSCEKLSWLLLSNWSCLGNLLAPLAAGRLSMMLAPSWMFQSPEPAESFRNIGSIQLSFAKGRVDVERLVMDLIEFARQHGHHGYWRVAYLLTEAGWSVSDGRIEWLWRREGLKVP